MTEETEAVRRPFAAELGGRSRNERDQLIDDTSVSRAHLVALLRRAQAERGEMEHEAMKAEAALVRAQFEIERLTRERDEAASARETGSVAADALASASEEGETDYQADPLANPSSYTEAEVDAAYLAKVCPKCEHLLTAREVASPTLDICSGCGWERPVGLRMYRLCGADYVVATSTGDAWEQYLGEVGHVEGFGIDGAVVPDDSELTILVDEAGRPTDETGRKRKLTARAWAELLGRGFAFSEEY